MWSRKIKLLWLILLISAVQAQRGGGRSSGGGGGGSRSGGFGGYGYSSYGYGRRSISCYQRCFGQPLCINNCQAQGTTAGIIVGSIFGSLCLCGLGSFLCCYCKKSPLCKWCYCHTYSKIKRQMNVVDTSSMSEQQFISKRDRIISWINSSNQANTFSFKQTGEYSKIQAQATIVKQGRNITELKINGHDKEGTWTANGFILCKNGSIFFWMYKQYNDKDMTGQTDDWEHLVYETTRYNDGQGLQGKWYFYGFQNSSEYSGEWRLFNTVNSSPYSLPNQGQNITYFNNNFQ